MDSVRILARQACRLSSTNFGRQASQASTHPHPFTTSQRSSHMSPLKQSKSHPRQSRRIPHQQRSLLQSTLPNHSPFRHPPRHQHSTFAPSPLTDRPPLLTPNEPLSTSSTSASPSTNPIPESAESSSTATPSTTRTPTPTPGTTHTAGPLPDLERPRYELTFTCRPCSARSSHWITKQGYHKGTVLITCPDCKNRHVISDHLQIFSDESIDVESMMREKGELVRRGRLVQGDGGVVLEDGQVEFWEDDDQPQRLAIGGADNKAT